MSFEFFQGFGSLGDAFAEGQKKEALQTLGQQLQSGDYDGAANTAFKAGDVNTGLSVLKLGQGKAAGAQADSWLSQLYGNGGGGGGSAAGGGAGGSTPSFAGGRTSMKMPADPAIESKFVGSLKDGGLTNPFGLGAMAAYANAESGYSPTNVTSSWSDPSQSGAPGTSGGILSWRGDRFANMRTSTAGADDPVAAQAKFAPTENPQLTMALQNAKSPEEANALVANAWKFAGYNDPNGREFQNRLGATHSYASRFASDCTPATAPIQTAQASPPPGAPPAADPWPQPAMAGIAPPTAQDGSGLDAGVA